MDYDVIVIGGGAAGIAAVNEARRKATRVALVVDGPIGGECTFTGCVPSKTLIAGASRGVTFVDAMTRVHRTVERIARNEDASTFEAGGIEVIQGRAAFRSPTVLDIDGTRVASQRVIIATGSAPAVPDIPGIDAVDYLTNENVFELQSLPSSLGVIGGGAVGCELAQAFARFGTRVTVVEGQSRLLSKEEPEASELIERVLVNEGVVVHTGAVVSNVRRTNGAIEMTIDGSSFSFERILIAAGRRAMTQDLDLDRTGVALDERGFVQTDRHMATNVSGVWAAGDVTGMMMFTHAAYAMGRIAASNALARSRKQSFGTRAIPAVTFTDPEIARVGITEMDAAENARVAELPISEVDRAITAGKELGFVKLISTPRSILGWTGGGRLVGATVVADRAGEMIHEAVLAMHTSMFVGRLAQAVHAYPTWSTGIQQTAAQFFVDVNGHRARPARIATKN